MVGKIITGYHDYGRWSEEKCESLAGTGRRSVLPSIILLSSVDE